MHDPGSTDLAGAAHYARDDAERSDKPARAEYDDTYQDAMECPYTNCSCFARHAWLWAAAILI
jgi:hypothetical protein